MLFQTQRDWTNLSGFLFEGRPIRVHSFLHNTNRWILDRNVALSFCFLFKVLFYLKPVNFLMHFKSVLLQWFKPCYGNNHTLCIAVDHPWNSFCIHPFTFFRIYFVLVHCTNNYKTKHGKTLLLSITYNVFIDGSRAVPVSMVV